MIGTAAQRREERSAAIVETAWVLARAHGIAGISLHALARDVGMRQPSLYVYFDSKHALYDAMFADANRQLLARLAALNLPEDGRAAVKAFMHAFVAFAMEDAERAALLFERPVPGFEPSAESYELAQSAMAGAQAVLGAAGVTSSDDVDCFIAMVAGLVAAQRANEPSGDRWIRHLDRLTDLYLDDVQQRSVP